MAITSNGSFQEQAVKRLLRHKDTAKYFNGDGWTEDPAQAETLFDVLEAAATCKRFKLTNVELALRVEPGACDVFCTPMS